MLKEIALVVLTQQQIEYVTQLGYKFFCYIVKHERWFVWSFQAMKSLFARVGSFVIRRQRNVASASNIFFIEICYLEVLYINTSKVLHLESNEGGQKYSQAN